MSLPPVPVSLGAPEPWRGLGPQNQTSRVGPLGAVVLFSGSCWAQRAEPQAMGRAVEVSSVWAGAGGQARVTGVSAASE